MSHHHSVPALLLLTVVSMTGCARNPAAGLPTPDPAGALARAEVGERWPELTVALHRPAYVSVFVKAYGERSRLVYQDSVASPVVDAAGKSVTVTLPRAGASNLTVPVGSAGCSTGIEGYRSVEPGTDPSHPGGILPIGRSSCDGNYTASRSGSAVRRLAMPRTVVVVASSCPVDSDRLDRVGRVSDPDQLRRILYGGRPGCQADAIALSTW